MTPHQHPHIHRKNDMHTHKYTNKKILTKISDLA